MTGAPSRPVPDPRHVRGGAIILAIAVLLSVAALWVIVTDDSRPSTSRTVAPDEVTQ